LITLRGTGFTAGSTARVDNYIAPIATSTIPEMIGITLPTGACAVDQSCRMRVTVTNENGASEQNFFVDLIGSGM